MAILFSWAVTTGFAHPVTLTKPSKNWAKNMASYVNSKKWTEQFYNFNIPANLFTSKIKVNCPLGYTTMTKSIKSLRERGQNLTREHSLKYQTIVNNRRFAIVYELAKCSIANKKLDFKKLILELEKDPSNFIIDPKTF